MNPLVRSPDEADASTAGLLRQMLEKENRESGSEARLSISGHGDRKKYQD